MIDDWKDEHVIFIDRLVDFHIQKDKEKEKDDKNSKNEKNKS